MFLHTLTHRHERSLAVGGLHDVVAVPVPPHVEAPEGAAASSSTTAAAATTSTAAATTSTAAAAAAADVVRAAVLNYMAALLGYPSSHLPSPRRLFRGEPDCIRLAAASELEKDAYAWLLAG